MSGWTLCSKKLPEALKAVYVTIEYTGDGSRYTDCMWYSERTERWYRDGSDSWTIPTNAMSEFEVVAWMDRPDPYRGDRE